MEYSIYREQCYGDHIFDSFELTINGIRKVFTNAFQEALLQLEDGTVLDVEVLGDELSVDVNADWLETSGREYEYFPSTGSYDETYDPLIDILRNRGVTFNTREER
jgi:hypothetical protein